jgi:hypothetical protein
MNDNTLAWTTNGGDFSSIYFSSSCAPHAIEKTMGGLSLFVRVNFANKKNSI